MTAESIAATAKLKTGNERLLNRNIRVIPLGIIHITYNRLERGKMDSALRSYSGRALMTQPGISQAATEKGDCQ